jgi:YcxB-like protein
MPSRSVTFSISQDDMTDAYRTWYGASRLSMKSVRGWIVIWIALCVVAVASVVHRGTWAILVPVVVATVVWFGLLAGIIGLTYLGIGRMSRRIFAQQRNLRDEYHVEWTGETIDIRTPNIASHHLWTDFIRWTENGSTIIIYQSDYMFNFIPKWTFGAGDLDDFRAQLVAAGVPRAKAFG